jgi:hypothetical protein
MTEGTEWTPGLVHSVSSVVVSTPVLGFSEHLTACTC